MQKVVLARLAALGWAVWIGWLLALPAAAIPRLPAWFSDWFPSAASPLLPHLDKLVHGGLFFVLGLLLVPALRPRFGPTPRRGLAALALAGAYGASTEMGQYLFTDRSAEVGDLAADTVGAALAVGLIVLRDVERAGSQARSRSEEAR